MTHLAQSRPVRSSPIRQWLVSAFTAIGAILAALGAFISFGPDNAQISVFAWEWESGEVSGPLASWLMVGGGAVAALGAARGILQDQSRPSRWLTVLEAILVVGGIAATAIGVSRLI